MRPCHNYFLSFHIQNKVFHFTPLTQYIIGVPYEPFDRSGEYGLKAIKRPELQALGIEVPMTKFQYDLKRSGVKISRDQLKVKVKISAQG